MSRPPAATTARSASGPPVSASSACPLSPSAASERPWGIGGGTGWTAAPCADAASSAASAAAEKAARSLIDHMSIGSTESKLKL